LDVDFPEVSGYFAARRHLGGARHMARDLGNKYVCFKCGTKFYDLKKPIPTCPKCGTDQREAPQPKASSGRASRAAPKEVQPEVEVPEAETDDDEEDDEVDEKVADED
jgi:hypothetical protein